MTLCPLNVQISLIVASIFHISAVYGPIGLCFRYDASVGFCYHIFRAHGPITSFGVTGAPKMSQCTLNVQISLILASIFHILAVYGPIGFCFGYDALVGLCYHELMSSWPYGPTARFRGPFLRERFIKGCLLYPKCANVFNRSFYLSYISCL